MKITAEIIDYLTELGLSKDAVNLYDLALEYENLSARDAAVSSGHLVQAEYRLFYMLEAHGLIRRLIGRPVRFQAIAPDVALPAALVLKRARLEELLGASNSNSAGKYDTAPARLVIGRQPLYDEYIRQASSAVVNIDVYAIGIAHSPELEFIQKSTLKRGVRIRHVIQELKWENHSIVQDWQRMGVKLRIQPSARGFHVMVFDSRTAIVSFSDPQHTDDRLSFIVTNIAAVQLFQKYFDEIWQSAHELQI